MRFILGIDIGWSATRPTCGLAWEGSSELFPGRGLQIENRIHACKFRKTDLLTHLSALMRTQRELLEDAIIVIDGPLGANGQPKHNRSVDRLCSSGGFHLRTQAYYVTNPNSVPFINATYEILAALGEQASRAVWIGQAPMVDRGMVVVETNPTVVLAVLMPQQAPNTLPTRHRHLRGKTRTIGSKSDWYWDLGANEKVAKVLDCPVVAGEHDHEKVAALTCLAVAKELANGGRARLGDGDGIYAFLRKADASWEGTITNAEGQGFLYQAQA